MNFILPPITSTHKGLCSPQLDAGALRNLEKEPPAPGHTGIHVAWPRFEAGVWLTDQQEEYHGNLHVWPGTHLRFGEYLAERGAEALAELSKDTSGAPYPKIELREQLQTFGTAGSVLFAHYLLGHNIGGNTGPDRRETIYYRLQAHGHRDRWRDVVTDPLSEFRAA